MSQTIPFIFESARVVLHVLDDGSATVSSLHAADTGKGYAKAVMQKLIDFADENKLRLVLDVQQFQNPRGLSNEDLIEFYMKFGFDVVNPAARPIVMWRASQ